MIEEIAAYGAVGLPITDSIQAVTGASQEAIRKWRDDYLRAEGVEVGVIYGEALASHSQALALEKARILALHREIAETDQRAQEWRLSRLHAVVEPKPSAIEKPAGRPMGRPKGSNSSPDRQGPKEPPRVRLASAS